MALPEELEEQIVVGMFDRGLLGFPEGGRELKSGRTSPYYYNNRFSLSFSKKLHREEKMSIDQQREFRAALYTGFAHKLEDLVHSVDHIFGKAQAGTSAIAVGAFLAGLSYVWERVDEPGKTYGAHQKVEGSIEPGETVGLGDDVITDGGSKVKGIEVLKGVDLVPLTVTTQFDREEGGATTLREKYGFEVNALTGLSRAALFLRENTRIGDQEIDSLRMYHEGLRADNIASTFNID